MEFEVGEFYEFGPENAKHIFAKVAKANWTGNTALLLALHLYIAVLSR